MTPKCTISFSGSGTTPIRHERVDLDRGQPFLAFVAFTAPHFPLQALPEDIARYRGTYRRGWELLRTNRWNRMQQWGLGGSVLSAPERDLAPPSAFPEALQQWVPMR